MEFCNKILVSLLLFVVSFLQPSSSFLPIPMYGITTSWYEEHLLSNLGRDQGEQQNLETLCYLCNTIVQGGTEGLYVHYLASHLDNLGMTNQMAQPNPPPNPSTASPFWSSPPPLPPLPPTNLTHQPSTSAASTSNHRLNQNPLLALNHNNPFLVQDRLTLALHNTNQAGPSMIRPELVGPHDQDQVAAMMNNTGHAQPAQPAHPRPPVIRHYERRRRRGQPQDNNQISFMERLIRNQAASHPDVIDVDDFEDGSSDCEDIDQN